jgi:very-short-patch-repair endonuclease
VVALKRFLSYAATGIEDIPVPTDKGFGSPFEEQVARAVQRHGYTVKSQVGVAGFFIDLAVPHPEQPGRFLLGIECDGAQYHSSRCARDRDRLRQQVLEDRGWTIVRVWSTDWFRDPDGQTRKVIDALAAARSRPSPLAAPMPKPAPQGEVLRQSTASVPPPPRLARYVEASFAVPSTPIHQLRRDELAEVCWRILDVEAPIHREEIAKRVTSLWGLSRTGARIAGAVDDALHLLQARNRAQVDADFFSVPGRRVVPRDREGTASASLRKAESLPPQEIQSALRIAVHSNQGIDEERLLVEALRQLGFKTIGAQVRALALAQLQALLRTSTFELREGRLYLTQSPTVGSAAPLASMVKG